jgi:hypothetical protein
MLIHAYRRKEAIEVSLFDQTIVFAPNADGAVVAEVEDERCIERLLSIDEAYTQHNAPDDGEASEPDPLVLTNDAGETLDIGKMTAKQVRALAAAQEPPIELPGGNGTPVAELRVLLAHGLRSRD